VIGRNGIALRCGIHLPGPAMPFIHRNAAGSIESLHRHGDTATEFLADGHPEVQAFVGGGVQPEFDQLDADFVRVIEDVIDTLIVRNIINITDLPGEAQAKLFARKSFRERTARNSLRLFSDTQFGTVIDDTNFGELP
jgi:hypothetical protein